MDLSRVLRDLRDEEFGSHSHGDRVFRKRDGDDDRYTDRKTAIFRLRDRQQREKI